MKKQPKLKDKDWLKKFFPTPAYIVRTRREALLHVRRKYSGCRPKTLSRYGLGYTYGEILTWEGQRILTFDRESCALCQYYLDCVRTATGEVCPLKNRNDCAPEYYMFLQAGDPVPMIEKINRILQEDKERKGKACPKTRVTKTRVRCARGCDR